MRKTLDSIIQAALDEALAALAARAKDLVFEAAQAALEARVKALLEEEGLTPAPAALARAKAKVQATPALDPESPEAPAPAQATPVKARKRAKAAQATPAPAQDLEAILQVAQVALEKYRGITTPKGKSLTDVLGRRLRSVLKHAQGLGRTDLQALAQRALALINADPRGAAMASWQALAARLGLPVPMAQGE